MDLLDRDLSQVKLSVTHKRLHELHPADVADILEQLAPAQRARVFEHLDNEQAADTISELEDELQADVIDDLSERRASDLLAEMDPDDAADIIGDLPYDKAETLLRLMGVKESSAIRSLLGYKEKTAGGIMTPEVTTVTEDMTVAAGHRPPARRVRRAREHLLHLRRRGRPPPRRRRSRCATCCSRRPTRSSPRSPSATCSSPHVDDDQEDVAEQMSKYDLLAHARSSTRTASCSASSPSTTRSTSSRRRPPRTSRWRPAPPATPAPRWAWLRWFVRRNWWIVVWALVGGRGRTRCAPKLPRLGDSAVLLVPALVLLPIVLRIAEDIYAARDRRDDRGVRGPTSGSASGRQLCARRPLGLGRRRARRAGGVRSGRSPARQRRSSPSASPSPPGLTIVLVMLAGRRRHRRSPAAASRPTSASRAPRWRSG